MNFSITSKLNKQAYIKTMFIGLYKKPAFILSAILGLYYWTTIILDHFKIIDLYVETPWFEMVCGTFLLFMPSLIVWLSVSQLRSNPSFLNEITFTFTDEGMKVEGMTFKSEFSWAHILKQNEINNFLILYHTKKFGNFIDRSKLTEEQLLFIKSKIVKK